MKLLIVLASISMIVGGCSYINEKLGQEADWVGEEILEKIIESQTGINIDLTPNNWT